MNAVGVTWGRTIGRARSLFSTALAIGGFLSATAVVFAFNLEAAEGGDLSFAMVWALSASQVLPFLAAALATDVWSEERRSGRIEILLSTAVRERDLVLGKFAGVWTLSVLSVLVSLASTALFLSVFAPRALAGTSLPGVLSAVSGLLMQGMLWCAASVATSAMFASAASSFCGALVLTVGLPRGAWYGLMAFSRQGRTAFGAFPFEAQILDAAGGVIPLGSFAGCLVVMTVFLFVAAKCVALLRFTGRGGGRFRVSTAFVVFLAVVCAVLSVTLFERIDFTLEFPGAAPNAVLSPRTRGVLSESSGQVSVTCLLPRTDQRFRSVERFLRRLKRESDAVGGARFVLRYVDPRWDIGSAERLAARGVTDPGLVFEQGRRMVSVPFGETCGERACASAIRRLAVVSRRRNVYWTIGHGESRFDEYGPFGMSDIARDLARDGYLNRPIDLAASAQVPGDCALIVVAGARDAFSRVELGRLDAYLREGGRLLVLLGSVRDAGVDGMLPAWGIRPVVAELAAARTVSGSDVIVSDFPDHPITAPLKGSRLLLERPLTFVPSAAAETQPGMDGLEYAPVALVGSSAVAVSVERGGGAGADVAIRPTRIVVVGDASFVMNSQLASRANVNRDFLLNCAAYLSGTDIAGAAGTESGLLITGLDRDGRLRMTLWSATSVPLAVFLAMIAVAFRRRRS